jgi:hypothetical protein
MIAGVIVSERRLLSGQRFLPARALSRPWIGGVLMHPTLVRLRTFAVTVIVITVLGFGARRESCTNADSFSPRSAVHTRTYFGDGVRS